MKEAAQTKAMLTEHDQDVLLHCRRLGHEVAFGYCRQEMGGRPCRLILDCWWEHFDVRAFLRAHLPEEVMADVEQAGTSPPPSKVLSLLDLIQQAKTRPASESEISGDPPPGSKSDDGRTVLLSDGGRSPVVPQNGAPSQKRNC
jgi:hypothetical protein